MANKEDISIVVITPESQVLDEIAQAVVIPAHDGELGVLLDRAPIMCDLGIGQLRYEKDGKTKHLFIDGGFAQVYQNMVRVLTPRAISAADVTPEFVAQQESALEQAAASGETTPEERQKLQARVSTLRAIQKHSA